MQFDTVWTLVKSAYSVYSMYKAAQKKHKIAETIYRILNGEDVVKNATYLVTHVALPYITKTLAQYTLS